MKHQLNIKEVFAVLSCLILSAIALSLIKSEFIAFVVVAPVGIALFYFFRKSNYSVLTAFESKESPAAIIDKLSGLTNLSTATRAKWRISRLEENCLELSLEVMAEVSSGRIVATDLAFLIELIPMAGSTGVCISTKQSSSGSGGGGASMLGEISTSAELKQIEQTIASLLGMQSLPSKTNDDVLQARKRQAEQNSDCTARECSKLPSQVARILNKGEHVISLSQHDQSNLFTLLTDKRLLELSDGRIVFSASIDRIKSIKAKQKQYGDVDRYELHIDMDAGTSQLPIRCDVDKDIYEHLNSQLANRLIEAKKQDVKSEQVSR